tara:strand:- start:249 stop:356 length:108 start_codon:yes stop_codon:yes gene_type:complete
MELATSGLGISKKMTLVSKGRALFKRHDALERRAA